MTNGEFERLSERYNNGKCTPEEIAFIETWVELNCGVDQHDATIFGSEADATITETEIWQNIQIFSGLKPKPKKKSKRNWLISTVAAAVTLIVISVVIGLREQPGELPLAGLETYNTSLSEQRIILPDSSIVILSEGASIITDENYGEHNRTVRLTGEAFFDIKRNPNKPFLVYSGELVTEVLGTSFHVKPGLDNKAIEVSVVTGKVSVYVSEKDHTQRKSGVIIIPNQKVVFNTKLKTIRQDIVDEPKIVGNKALNSVFNFDAIPVSEVLDVLRQAYGIDIVLSKSGIGDCRFTGDLSGFELFRQLDYICDVIDAEYEVRGTTIFMTGNECQTLH